MNIVWSAMCTRCFEAPDGEETGSNGIGGNINQDNRFDEMLYESQNCKVMQKPHLGGGGMYAESAAKWKKTGMVVSQRSDS